MVGSVKDFLPMSRTDMEARGWDELDFIFVSGDAYVDHPGFGTAIICRVLEAHGYRVGIIAQPDWHSAKDFRRLGKPRLAFLVSSGNLDSVLARFTAAKKLRRQDAYSPGGRMNCRPERAVSVYVKRLREAWGAIPVIIGGIEASLRRMAHYDYWRDEVRPSILLESGADLLIYGMGEKQIVEIAAELHAGVAIENVQDVRGTCYRVPNRDYVWDYVELPPYAAVAKDKAQFADAFRVEYLEQDALRGRRLIQQNEEICVVQNPPALPLTTEEMDEIYELPYRYTWHPVYDKVGGVPAIAEVKFSLVSQRGCFGGCNFCAIVSHQGRIIQHRSKESLLREAKRLIALPDFKGYISDLGGPSANMYGMRGHNLKACERCKRPSCIHPAVCPNLDTDHTKLLDVYHAVDALPGLKKSFIGSGIRYDLLLHEGKDERVNASARQYTRELIMWHVSGRLKIAPEHTQDDVLRLMRKPSFAQFYAFKRLFDRINKEAGLKQQLIPYFISSHPGCREEDMAELAVITKALDFHLEQVQDFTPTPMTISTEAWYTGYDPYTLEPVYSAKTPREKLAQRQFFFWYKPEERRNIARELRRIGREDLITRLFPKGENTDKARQHEVRYSDRPVGSTFDIKGKGRKSFNPNFGKSNRKHR